ncbi:hypothetical protein EDD16DRAFT_1619579 [Pisolithus croceorrhizus]|nr:hypothetical protein EDD16DRAFT_1619579 [Pisolithus croceorrhizus]
MNHIVTAEREPDKLAASTTEHRQAQSNHVPADPSRLAPPQLPAQQNILNPSAMSAHLGVSQQNPQPFDPTSFLPQHFMQEFLRLSTPVGQNPDDDAVLVRALHDSRQNGKTYKQALEGLHGINNHAANLWKDYYLDHHDRIEMLVSRLNQQPKTVKKPFTTIPAVQERSGTSSSQATQKRKLSPTLASDRSSPKLRGRTPKLSQSKRFSHTPPAQTTTTIRPPKRLRATMNSLSADPVPTANTMVRGLTPPHADIPIPDPPSRSPTPPTKIHIGTHGNRYTPEDRDYFIKFITWRLKHDPSSTKKELCDQLAIKVPHHSSTSWASHWHTRHDLADKILATYRRGADAESRASSEPMSIAPTSERHSPPPGDPWPYCSDQDADTEDDEADMGEPGTPFTRGDWCMFARFMARGDWDEMAPKERFDTFAESHDTERSAKSWAEFYRRNQDALLKLSKRYSKQEEDSEDIYNRRARPSWAQRCPVSDKSPSDEDGNYEIDEGDN